MPTGSSRTSRSHPDFIRPVSRKNEMMNNFLKKGLQDLCVSRTSFKWGIPVDFDEKHVVYVWLDALTNYITGLGYDPDGKSGELYETYWKNAEKLHVIGKDIARFHTIYWPIFLMALGEPLPDHVFAHPWLLQGGEKMSKSRGNVIYADDLASVFGVDAVRYFVLHEMPYEGDGTITWELMCERVNSDLANTLGNLVRRTLAMTRKYFGGESAERGRRGGGGRRPEGRRHGGGGKGGACMDDYPCRRRPQRDLPHLPPREQVYRRDDALGARQGRGEKGPPCDRAVQPHGEHSDGREPACALPARRRRRRSPPI